MNRVFLLLNYSIALYQTSDFINFNKLTYRQYSVVVKYPLSFLNRPSNIKDSKKVNNYWYLGTFSYKLADMQCQKITIVLVTMIPARFSKVRSL